jgi:hypothetical protein
MVSVGATAHVDDVVPPVVVVEVEFDVDDGEAGEPVQAPEIAALTAADNAPMAWRRFIRSSLALGFRLRASAGPPEPSAKAVGLGAIGFSDGAVRAANSRTRRAMCNTGARLA